MAAVRVRAASSGDMGIFDKFDCPKWREKKNKIDMKCWKNVGIRKIAIIESLDLFQRSIAFNWIIYESTSEFCNVSTLVI